MHSGTPRRVAWILAASFLGVALDLVLGFPVASNDTSEVAWRDRGIAEPRGMAVLAMEAAKCPGNYQLMVYLPPPGRSGT